MSETAKQSFSIVVIDDDQLMLNQVQALLNHKLDATVYTFSNAKSALSFLVSNTDLASTIDAVVCDISMPQMSGHDFLVEMRSLNKDVPVIFLTGTYDTNSLSQALRLDAFDALKKPPNLQVFTQSVAIACRVGQLRREASDKFSQIKRLIDGTSFTEANLLLVSRLLDEIAGLQKRAALLTLVNHAQSSSD